jgi:hypothetical protein
MTLYTACSEFKEENALLGNGSDHSLLRSRLWSMIATVTLLWLMAHGSWRTALETFKNCVPRKYLKLSEPITPLDK